MNMKTTEKTETKKKREHIGNRISIRWKLLLYLLLFLRFFLCH